MSFQDVIGHLTFDETHSEDLGGELVADAVVLLRLVNQETGDESLQIVNTVGLSDYAQIGMLRAASSIVENFGLKDDD